MHLKFILSSLVLATTVSLTPSSIAYPAELLHIPEDVREAEVEKIPLEALMLMAKNASYRTPDKVKLFSDYVEVLTPRTSLTGTEEIQFYFDLWTKVLFPVPPKINAEQLKRYNAGLSHLKSLTAKVLKDKYSIDAESAYNELIAKHPVLSVLVKDKAAPKSEAQKGSN